MAYRVAALRFFYVRTLKRPAMKEDLPYPHAPKHTRRLPTILTPDEVSRLIDSARNLFHYAMLLTMYSAGLRRSELCRLKVNNIDSGRMVLRVERGKGGVDRELPLNPKLLTTLREYWRWMRPKTYLFPGTSNGWRTDKPITPKVIWEAVQAAARKAGIQKHVTPHTLRHCFATHMLERGGPANHSGADGPQGYRRDDSLSACVSQALAGSYPSFGADSCLRSSTLTALEEVTQAGMTRPTVEVADLLRTQGDRFVAENRSWLSYQQLKVLRAIQRCRTPTLGGHLDQCSGCVHSAISCNSCRDRHCPKCQAQARQRWLACREQELLGLSYFHVVFTLPHELNRLCQRNPALLYNLLFRSVSETLLEVAADPKHLGAAIGFLAILHRGQNLLLHPHIHCLVPVGGLSPDRSHWVQPRYRSFSRSVF